MARTIIASRVHPGPHCFWWRCKQKQCVCLWSAGLCVLPQHTERYWLWTLVWGKLCCLRLEMNGNNRSGLRWFTKQEPAPSGVGWRRCRPPLGLVMIKPSLQPASPIHRSLVDVGAGPAALLAPWVWIQDLWLLSYSISQQAWLWGRRQISVLAFPSSSPAGSTVLLALPSQGGWGLEAVCLPCILHCCWGSVCGCWPGFRAPGAHQAPPVTMPGLAWVSGWWFSFNLFFFRNEELFLSTVVWSWEPWFGHLF